MAVLINDFNWLQLWRPDVCTALMLVGGVYFSLVGPLRKRFKLSSPPTAIQLSTTLAILALLYIAMGSPLNLIAERFSFTGYVLQMLIVTQIVAPLFFIAVPPWLLQPLVAQPILRRVFKVACSPVAAPIVYNVFATVFLLPDILSASLSNNLLHTAVQYLLMLSAVFLWWPLLSRVSALPRLTPGAQLIYLLFAVNFMMPIIVFLFFSETPWYPVYAHSPFGSSPMADQQVGALLMATGMLLVYALRAFRPFVSHSDAKWYE